MTPIAVAYDCLFPYTTGGGERQYRAFATEIGRRGISVEYLTSTQWDGAVPAIDRAVTVTAVAPRLRLHDEAGVRRFPAALRFAWGLYRALRRRRRSYRGAIVSGLPVLNVFAARAALRRTDIPLVVDYLEVWGAKQWREYAGPVVGRIAWILQRAAIAITPVASCHSELSATRLRAEGYRGRILLSPGLIDVDTSPPFARDASAPPYVLYAGRHIPDKRVESLPAAIARARADHPELRLVILGSGPSAPAISEAVDRVGAGEWVDRPGFVDDDRLAELMSGAAVVVNPSRREGYGLVVVESAAHGTPVVLVADDGNASVELISPGQNGFVAASTSPEELGAAISRAVSGGRLLRESTRAWYDEAIRTRSIARTVDAILDAMGLSPDSRLEPPSRTGDVRATMPSTEGTP